MGAVAVCSVLGGGLRCGMVRGDGGGSAGHAGAGQGGHAEKSLFYVYTCTHDLALVNELVEISGIFRRG